jgi:hypothetical protein
LSGDAGITGMAMSLILIVYGCWQLFTGYTMQSLMRDHPVGPVSPSYPLVMLANFLLGALMVFAGVVQLIGRLLP